MTPRGYAVVRETVTLPELPAWCHGVAYRSDDDVTTLRVLVPEEQLAPHLGTRDQLLALEMDPDALTALVEALQKCLSRSRQAAKVLEIPSQDDD